MMNCGNFVETLLPLVSGVVWLVTSATLSAGSNVPIDMSSKSDYARAIKSLPASTMVFSAEKDGQWDIFAWRPLTGQEPVRLTSDPSDELRPSLSHDRSSVIYEDTSGRIWDISLNSRIRRQLLTSYPTNKFIQPAASPSGAMALFAMRHDPSQDNTDLAFYPMGKQSGSSVGSISVEVGPAWAIQARDDTRVLDMVSAQFSPCWAPDGKRLAFANLHDRGSAGGRIITEIWETRLDHSYVRQLTLLHSLCEDPSWSPKTDRIAFSCNKFKQFDIFSVDLDTGAVKRLTTDPACDADPVYSPDGRYIAFVSLRSGVSSLHMLDIEKDTILKLNPFGTEDVPCKDPDWK